MNAPHADIKREQNNGQFQQPLPQIARLKSLYAVVEERVVRRHVRIQDLASAGLAQSSQQIIVWLSRAEFGRVIHARTEHLRAAHFAVFDVHQIEQIRAHFPGGKPRLVVSRAGLFQTRRQLLAFRADNRRLQIQEVPVISLFVERLDADDAFAFVNRHVGRKVRIVQAPQTPLRNLGPELPILFPSQPVLGPLPLCVRSERDRPAQAKLPVRQQRVPLVGQQRRFGSRFLARRHVAAQLRIFSRANAADQFAGGNLLRFEWLFVNRRF